MSSANVTWRFSKVVCLLEKKGSVTEDPHEYSSIKIARNHSSEL
jgi:hypothetical protein